METVLGIDPGHTHSAYALVGQDYAIRGAAKLPNGDLLRILSSLPAGTVAIECLQSFGMPVGREVFDTAYWIGRFWERASHYTRVCLYPRPLIARSLIGGKFSDSALRSALLLRFGSDRKGQPMHALKGSTDIRSAFAVAVYHLDGARLGAWDTEPECHAKQEHGGTI